MISNQPSDFSADLTDERLKIICEQVLDTVQDSIDDSSTKNDTKWTRGCLRYGRVHGLLIQLTLDKNYPWLILANKTLDFTFRVGKALVQYVYDDYEAPKKGHRIKPNTLENTQLALGLDLDEELTVASWRLYVNQELGHENEQLKATLVGYDINQTAVCIWSHEDKINIPMFAEQAEAVDIPEPMLTRKKKSNDIRNEAK